MDLELVGIERKLRHYFFWLGFDPLHVEQVELQACLGHSHPFVEHLDEEDVLHWLR